SCLLAGLDRESGVVHPGRHETGLGRDAHWETLQTQFNRAVEVLPFDADRDGLALSWLQGHRLDLKQANRRSDCTLFLRVFDTLLPWFVLILLGFFLLSAERNQQAHQHARQQDTAHYENGNDRRFLRRCPSRDDDRTRRSIQRRGGGVA